MISFIKGRVEKCGQDSLHIDVNGVGYRIFTSVATIGKVKKGQMVKLHTQMIVREDSISLYGFIEEDELFLFEKLITVSGIGPRVALGILSGMSPASFTCLVVDGNVEQLMKIPGIGRKTGERLILELKDKLDKYHNEYAYEQIDDNRKEALEALVSLGFDAAHVRRVLSGIGEQETDTAQLIKLCLKGLKS